MDDRMQRNLITVTCLAVLAHLAWTHLGPAPALASDTVDRVDPSCVLVAPHTTKKAENTIRELTAGGRSRLVVIADTVLCAW